MPARPVLSLSENHERVCNYISDICQCYSDITFASLRGANESGPEVASPMTGSATKQSSSAPPSGLLRFARNDEKQPYSARSVDGRDKPGHDG